MSNPNIAQDSSTTFKPGQSGNPKGRAKRSWTFAGLLEDSLEEQDETGVSYKKILMRKLRNIGAKGDTTAIKMIMDRLDGMPQQSMKHSGEIKLPNPIYNGKSTE